jgi:glycosyltransferase 2 family protein
LQVNFKSISKLVKSLYLIAVFLFIAIFLYNKWNDLINFKLDFRASYLFLSIILLMTFPFLNVIIWFLITKRNNCNISLKKTIILRLYSELGKYIPGKIWGYGMLILYYSKEGISKKSIAVCSFFELITSVLGAVFIFIFSLIFIDNSEIQAYRSIAFIFLIVFFIIIHPVIIEFFSNKILRLLKREKVSIQLSYFDILKLICLYTINWLVFGFAFFVFINSFYKLSINHYFYITGSLSLSSLIGFFALFAPAGLGVREGILILTLKNIVSVQIAGIISIVSRIWTTVGELLLILVFFIYDKIKKIL